MAVDDQLGLDGVVGRQDAEHRVIAVHAMHAQIVPAEDLVGRRRTERLEQGRPRSEESGMVSCSLEEPQPVHGSLHSHLVEPVGACGRRVGQHLGGAIAAHLICRRHPGSVRERSLVFKIVGVPGFGGHRHRELTCCEGRCCDHWLGRWGQRRAQYLDVEVLQLRPEIPIISRHLHLHQVEIRRSVGADAEVVGPGFRARAGRSHSEVINRTFGAVEPGGIAGVSEFIGGGVVAGCRQVEQRQSVLAAKIVRHLNANGGRLALHDLIDLRDATPQVGRRLVVVQEHSAFEGVVMAPATVGLLTWRGKRPWRCHHKADGKEWKESPG